jgi:hypothetical protein
MIKYILFTGIIVCTLISCPYFDPMHGSTYIEYGNTYSRSFTENTSLLICEKGQWSNNNVGVYQDTIYVVYYNETTNHLILSRSNDRGLHWKDAELTGDNGGCSIICMKELDNNLYISYDQGGRLYCIVSYDGGETMRCIDIAPINSNGDGYTGITGYGNNIYISYSTKTETDGYCNMMCACSTDRGMTFSTDIVEESIPGYASASSIAYNPLTGNVHIIYQGDGDRVIHAKSTDLDNWTGGQVSETEHRSSKILVDPDNTIHVVFAGVSGVRYVSGGINGESWPTENNFDTSVNFASDISFSEDNGTFYVAYYDVPNTEFNIATGPSWSIFTLDVNSSGGGTSGRLCSIDAYGSFIVATYVDNGGEDELDENNRLRLFQNQKDFSIKNNRPLLSPPYAVKDSVMLRLRAFHQNRIDRYTLPLWSGFPQSSWKPKGADSASTRQEKRGRASGVPCPGHKGGRAYA